MKNRLTGKPACIAILAVLIILSLADVLLRTILFREVMFINNLGAAGLGEPFATVLLSVLLIVFARKGKDRFFYLLCGAFLGYFVLNQLFGLPGAIASFVTLITNLEFWLINPVTTIFAVLLQIFSMICIVAIGGLVLEYMNDGTIYNRAFNSLCLAALLMQSAYAIIGIYDVLSGEPAYLILSVIHNLSRIAMLFLFVFFAYDSAKKQLAKTKL